VAVVDPLPVLDAGARLIQLADSDAVQLQPVPVVTANAFVVPAAIGAQDVGLTV
jgi:hypothetical protein